MVSEAGRRQSRAIDLKNGRVDMRHGAGGRAMSDLVDQLFRAAFDNPMLNRGDDQACFDIDRGRMVMTTDSFVISPLFFPGGNIGSLAVHGTVNDLAMGGAEPLYLSTGFILEEGFPLKDLKCIVDAMAAAAREAGVAIVTGDTKVVERGKGDGVFINTAGVGHLPDGVSVSGDRARPGDRVILSGSIGDHGIAIMSQRKGLRFATELESDSAALNGLVAAMVASEGHALRVMRDPTRGGVAATLNEIAQHALGQSAAIVGEIIEDPLKLVRMATHIGGERVIDWLHGEQLPRIC